MGSDISSQYYEYYDLIYNDRTVDLRMWRQFAQEADGPVLEIGCGTGRVLRALVKTGCPLTGIEVSPTAIQLARSKIEAPNVSVLRADMRDFDLPNRDFVLVLIPFNTFLHCASLEEQLSCLRSIHKHMVEGARLVIDIFFPPAARATADVEGRLHLGREFVAADGCVVQWYSGYTSNLAEQTMDCVQTLDRIDSGGIVHRAVIRFPYRFIYRREMELLLKVTEFEVESIYGDYDFSPFGEHSRNMVFVARKSDSHEL